MTTIKCVVWDLDGTVWDAIALEAPEDQPPRPRAPVLALMRRLAERGVVSSAASRTDPAMLRLVQASPDLAELLFAPQLGWQDKSTSIARVAAEMGIGLDAVAFVDDSGYERAEVSARLPDVLVLAPEEMLDAVESPAFAAGPATPESAERLRYYRDEQRRRHAEEIFAGDRDQFLTWTQTALALSQATGSDVARLAELAVRTNRFNSTGQRPGPSEIAARVADRAGWFVPVARLQDRFGSYGLVGAALVGRGEQAWWLELFMVSCRAAGREVPRVLLASIIGYARRQPAGPRRFVATVRDREANVGLRVLLRQCGFTSADPPGEAAAVPAGAYLLARQLDEPAAETAGWLTVTEAYE